MRCKAKSIRDSVALAARLNTLEEVQIKCTLRAVSKHLPDIVSCATQSISPTMQLISAAVITKTVIESCFASTVGIASASHQTRELIVLKHFQKRIAVQANTQELL